MSSEFIRGLVTVITILLALGGVLWRLNQQFNKLGGRIDRSTSRIDGLATGVKSINQQLSSLFTLLSGVLAAFNKAGTLPDEDYRRTSMQLTEMLARGTEPFVESITAKENPLSLEESRRFRELVDKARRGEFFTQDEAEEYNNLLRRVQEERGNDPGIWPLVALGAFLLGLYLGRRRDNN